MTRTTTPIDAARNNQPLLLADVVDLCAQPDATANDLLRHLGPAVLVGHLTTAPSDDGKVLPERARQAGLSTSMLCWPLFRRGFGSALNQGLRVGRALSNDVRIDEPSIAKLHARITIVRGSASIVDLGSAGGTRLHGVTLRQDQPGILRDLDIVTLGQVQLRHVRTGTLFTLLSDRPFMRRAG